MRFTPRTWSLLSLMLFVAAVFFWLKGNEYQAQKKQLAPAVAITNANSSTPGRVDLRSTQASGLMLAQLASSAPNHTSAPNAGAQTRDLYPNRLRNSTKSLADLSRGEHSILLANALIDSDSAEPLRIPEHLRSKGSPGSYIVQWKSAPGAEFRRLLANAGAEIVSYVPNNAYLVKATADEAKQLQAYGGVQAVLPFEPYYKLEKSLLNTAVRSESLPPDAVVRLTLFPGTREAALRDVAALGAQLLAEELSPFGPQLVVQPPVDALASLASLDSVQGIEPVTARKLASDLSRIALGVATNGSASNYLNLSGSNVLVNLNDTGIQTNHPGLTASSILLPPAVIPMAGRDPEGHGTFVAGLIAGNGKSSPKGTNVFGSESNAVFRGMAPAAKLLALPLNTGSGSNNYPEVSDFNSDTWLIDTAARTNYLTLKRTNSLISNNSWTYERTGYDSAAARYDAAVRDALPGMTNSQPLLFVFAAGNTGFGDESGYGGQPDSIESPGTAKNVITVGALESFRSIDVSYTNKIIITNTDGTFTTNDDVVFPFIGVTDSDSEVASFSSRGNVGIGIEGMAGRFKPDVVAPGTMLVSARSEGWDFNGFDTNEPFGKLIVSLHTNIAPYRYDSGTTFAAANVSGMLALIEEYFNSRAPAPVRHAVSPALMKGLLINGARAIAQVYDVAVKGGVNFQGWGVPNLPNSLSSYDTNEHDKITDENLLRLRYVEQSATNALATGESRTWKVTLSTNASMFPLRLTLVWTDPPGNPAVGVKLVNDLDLVVTNTETGIVFVGNNFASGGSLTQPLLPEEGQILPFDFVNNVENIVIGDPEQFGREFTVTVRAHRVNVNAIPDFYSATRDTNDVVQDYALVVSSDMGADPSFNDPEDPNGYLPKQTVFEKFDAPKTVEFLPRPALTVVTNGLPLLTERVGANATLVSTNGVTNQWSFYVFTNVFIPNDLVTITNGPYVAFATFDAPNLSTPRLESDVDLYVSRGDPGLTNLNPKSLASAIKSVDRQGTETVAFTNSFIGEVFYVGVKSEDQKGGEFSLFGVSSQLPFERERNGRIELLGLPYSTYVPDGSARIPTAGTMIAIGLSDRRIARTVVTNRVSHENFGDLIGVLAHKSTRVVLNNHLGLPVGSLRTNTFAYDDSNFSTLPTSGTGFISKRSDGPGTLNDFAGEKLTGAWFLNMIDNQPSHTGRVEFLTITIDPLQKPLLDSEPINATNAPGQTLFYPIDVGVGFTNLVFEFTKVSGPLDIYFRQFELPQTNLFDIHTNVSSGNLSFSFPTTNTASLAPGTHFLAVRNPSTTASVTYTLEVTFGPGTRPGDSLSTGPITDGSVLDVATTNQVIDVPDDKLVAAVRVSVNMPHPRASDVIMSLLSPQGTRVVLAEQRGGSNSLGYGSAYTVTNATSTNVVTTYAVFTDDTNVARVPIKFADLSNPFGLSGTTPVLNNSFEKATNGNYAVGSTVAGWTVQRSVNAPSASPALVSIITGPNFAYAGTNALILGNASVRTNVTTTTGRAYKLRFAIRRAPVLDLLSSGVTDTGASLPPGNIDPHYSYLSTDFAGSSGTDAFILATNSKAFRTPFNWAPNSATSSWIAPFPTPTGDASILTYTFRTYIDLYSGNPATFIPSVRWASDSFDSDILVNGKSQKAPSARPTASALASAPFKPLAGLTAGLNIVDFVVNDSGEIPGIRVDRSGARLASSGSAQIDVQVAGRSVAVAAGTGWSIYTLDFIGDGRSSPVAFHSRTGEAWIDAVTIEPSGDIFVQPEEPFDILTGERAIGEWNLILQDARTGAVLPTGDLTWKLDLNYADPLVFAEPLYNGIFYPEDFLNGSDAPANPTNRITPGTLYTNQVHYFSVEPCANATTLTIILRGLKNFDAIELLADRSGMPTGDPETDDYVILRNNQNPGKADGVATFHIDRNRPAGAPYVGKRVFFAVRNRFLESTNSYQIRIGLSPGGCFGPPPPTLIKGKTVESTLAAASASVENEGDLFRVNVASGAQSISLNVQGDGDVAIVAQKGVPPTRDSFSHFQNNPGSGNEQLTITSTSGIPLTSGLWYVRVLNNATEPVLYSITATGDIGDAPAEQPLLSATFTGGQLQLQWNSSSGTVYGVQASDNLTDWSPVGSITATGAITTFNPPLGSGHARFYRLVQQ